MDWIGLRRVRWCLPSCYVTLEEGGNSRTWLGEITGARLVGFVACPIELDSDGGREGRELVCVCLQKLVCSVDTTLNRASSSPSDSVSLAMSIILRLISSSGMRKFMIATKRFLGSCGDGTVTYANRGLRVKILRNNWISSRFLEIRYFWFVWNIELFWTKLHIAPLGTPLSALSPRRPPERWDDLSGSWEWLLWELGLATSLPNVEQRGLLTHWWCDAAAVPCRLGKNIVECLEHSTAPRQHKTLALVTLGDKTWLWFCWLKFFKVILHRVCSSAETTWFPRRAHPSWSVFRPNNRSNFE